MLPRRTLLLAIAALSTQLLGSRDAAARPSGIDSLPADGAVLEEVPERVFVRFSTGIESRSTRIALNGPTGSSSLSIEGSGGEPVRELSIPVPDQGRGRYVVRWEIVAADGERIGGRVRFLVRPRKL